MEGALNPDTAPFWGIITGGAIFRIVFWYLGSTRDGNTVIMGYPGPASILLPLSSSTAPPDLVHLGCYTEIPKTGWCIPSKNVLLTVLEAGRLRSVHQHGWVRPSCRLQLSSHGRGASNLSLASFMRALTRAPPS